MLLTQAQINHIESKASEVLTNIHPIISEMKLPIDIEEVLKHFQIELKSGDFQDSTIAGAYDKKKRTIFVEKKETYPHKAFIIAHELGHFFLHEKIEAEFFYKEQLMKVSEEQSPQEQEANWFAVSLLMPKYLIEEYWELTGDPEQMTVIFGVSPVAVHFRLKNLQLLE